MEKRKRLPAIFQSRCPHCLQGKIFATFLRMHKTCSVCGIKFEREHGYFLMAIFFGYVLNGILFAPVALWLYLTGMPMQGFIVVGIIILLLAPFTFRYSRVVWLHIDELLDPRQPTQNQ